MRFWSKYSTNSFDFSSILNLCNGQNFEISPKCDIVTSQGWIPNFEFYMKNQIYTWYVIQIHTWCVKKAVTSTDGINWRFKSTLDVWSKKYLQKKFYLHKTSFFQKIFALEVETKKFLKIWYINRGRAQDGP